MCGENTPWPLFLLAARGSSPRVRGKLAAHLSEGAADGLIPACAGKTDKVVIHHNAGRAHPRVCGENLRVRDNTRRGRGSSPRVRGKLAASQAHVQYPRLIPACAGKTLSALVDYYGSAAHPRVCGENVISPLAIASRKGSSPRVRGKRIPPEQQVSWDGSSPRVRGKLVPEARRRTRTGLIPACAGKTLSTRF